MEQIITEEQQSTGKGKKILFIGLGLAATGTLGYFGYQWWQKRSANQVNKNDDNIPDTQETLPVKNKTVASAAAIIKGRDFFPLKKGSKGARVKELQEALIEKHGKQLLSKYGADGYFGSELVAALAKENYPASIDENTFNVIVQGGGLDAENLSKELYAAAIKKDFPAVIKSLQQLKSSDDYTAVSEIFKNNYRINGVRQTLVNGLLNSFIDDKQKQSIRLQFTRMGLNYDGKKWSLSGFESSNIITKQKTVVWVNPTTAIHVPKNMVLGKEIARKGKYTVFENNKQHFLVGTQSVNII